MIVFLSGNILLDQQSYCTLGLVSTWMGDHLWAIVQFIFLEQSTALLFVYGKIMCLFVSCSVLSILTLLLLPCHFAVIEMFRFIVFR